MSKTVSLILQLFTCYGIYPVNVSRGISTYISTSGTSPPNDGRGFSSAYNFNSFRNCSADSTSVYNIPPNRRSADQPRITTQHPSRLEKVSAHPTVVARICSRSRPSFYRALKNVSAHPTVVAQICRGSRPSIHRALKNVSAHPTVVAQISRGSRPSIYRAPKCCQHKIFIFLYFYLIK